jgi:hypothetical protein
LLGFVTGVAIGWSRTIDYWVHPILRFIGLLPATAWLPLSFFAFPSSWSAGVLLIARATGFPVAVLTWSCGSSLFGISGGTGEIAIGLGAFEQAPTDPVPTYELWVGRREGWLKVAPPTEEFPGDRTAVA